MEQRTGAHTHLLSPDSLTDSSGLGGDGAPCRRQAVIALAAQWGDDELGFFCGGHRRQDSSVFCSGLSPRAVVVAFRVGLRFGEA